MEILTTADLRGLDPTATDKTGTTPDYVFTHSRDWHCVIERGSHEDEMRAWRALLDSAIEQNGHPVENDTIVDG